MSYSGEKKEFKPAQVFFFFFVALVVVFWLVGWLVGSAFCKTAYQQRIWPLTSINILQITLGWDELPTGLACLSAQTDA